MGSDEAALVLVVKSRIRVTDSWSWSWILLKYMVLQSSSFLIFLEFDAVKFFFSSSLEKYFHQEFMILKV